MQNESEQQLSKPPEKFPGEHFSLQEEIESDENANEQQRDIPDDPEKMEQYTAANAEVEARIQETLQTKEALAAELEAIRARLDVGTEPLEPENFPSLAYLDDKLAALEKEKVALSANYPGHWTILLHERLQSPEIRARFIQTRSNTLDSLKNRLPGKLDKPKEFRSHYENQLAGYDDNLARVFNETAIGDAESFRKERINLGKGSIGDIGAVFDDAAHRDGTPLTSRQKMMVEAHEKGHGMRDFTGSDIQEVKEALDLEVLAEREAAYSTSRHDRDFSFGYLTKPEEIIERMSQLKNYFGFKGGEEFTDQHLAHAMRHYVADTGLDNSMSHFFAGISPRTRKRFLEIMNSYPI